MDISNFKFDRKEIEKNKITIGYVVIGLIFVWFGYTKIYQPSMEVISRLKSDISDEAAKKDISFRVARLQDASREYKQYFASGKDVSWLIDKVSAAAKESGLEIVSLNPQQMVTLSNFLYCRIGISLNGTYHQLGDFAAVIDGSNEFIKIEKLSFKKNGDILNAEAAISTYFWKGA